MYLCCHNINKSADAQVYLSCWFTNARSKGWYFSGQSLFPMIPCPGLSGNANIFDSGMSFLRGLSQTPIWSSDWESYYIPYVFSSLASAPWFKREYTWYTPPGQISVVSASSSLCCGKFSKSFVIRTCLTQIMYVTWGSFPVHPWHTINLPLILCGGPSI